MTNQPLISVVIPTHNEAHLLARAVQSMQQQTYKSLEIIVVDDWSTDTTAEVMQAITAQDARVKYVKLPYHPKTRKNWRGYDINAGFDARNYGFKLAKGEWITTQDADDASLLNRIEAQYELAKKYQAMLVTIAWQRLTPEVLQKQLDVDKIFAEHAEAELVIRPETICAVARANQGLLMCEPFHQFLPFPLKWFPYTRKLFYPRVDAYPGADNSMLFQRQVLDDGIYFRPRNERTWGVPSGRGSGRDFAFRVAMHYKNSWSFKLPLYLWDVKNQNGGYEKYDKYLRAV